jgi:di/tricarboxylate transporter
LSSFGLEPHAIAALLTTLGALILFTRERIPLEYSCLVILCVLVIGFEAVPFERSGQSVGAVEFLSGFGNEALITICLLLMLGKGVEVSGALRPLGRRLTRIWLINQPLALLATLLIAAALSAFANNTPIVMMILPVLVGVALRIGLPPSRILMPAGFATIVGGMSTSIGTSTNLLVVSVSADLGMPRLQMFDFALPAVLAAIPALLYLWIIAPRLLPDRRPPLARSTPHLFESAIEVNDDSPLDGKTLADIRRLIGKDARIERVQRGGGVQLVRLPSLTIRAGDRLRLRGSAEAIKEAQNLFGGGFAQEDLQRMPEQVLVQIVVTRESPLHGKPLSAVRELMADRLIPIGVYSPRSGTQEVSEPATDPELRSGDVLLAQGRRSEIRRLKDRHDMLILDRTVRVFRATKAPLALAIMAGVVAVAALGWLPIIGSAACGLGLMLAGRCLSLDEAWSALDSKIVLVIVTSLALGAALTTTGAAEFIAHQFVGAVADLPPAVVLSGLLLLTALLTEIVTNNAVAVIATPIAMAVARELGVSEVAFVLAVLFGANMSYLTPIGYQTNLLVFAAGGYRFSDFLRAGIPLQLILWLALSFILPGIYL